MTSSTAQTTTPEMRDTGQTSRTEPPDTLPVAPPDRKLVSRFWDHMTRRFGAEVIRKSDATEMKFLARVLSMAGLLSATRFLTKYATTIGRKIYVPWKIAKTDDPEALWQQMMTCVREVQHVFQWQREGVSFPTRYLGSSLERARYEAEALRCDMELHWLRHGEILNPHVLASSLEDRGCQPRDIETATKLLAASAADIARGGVLNQATNEALQWIQRHAPGLVRRDIPVPNVFIEEETEV